MAPEFANSFLLGTSKKALFRFPHGRLASFFAKQPERRGLLSGFHGFSNRLSGIFAHFTHGHSSRGCCAALKLNQTAHVVDQVHHADLYGDLPRF
jgi:hypothetical protein